MIQRLFRAGVALALSSVVLGGCSADVDSGPHVSQRVDGLNGTVTWNASYPCTATQQATIERAMDILVDQVITSPNPLRDCLRDAILSPDDGSYAEDTMRRIAENMPTEIRCKDSAVHPCGGGYNWSGCAGIGIESEILSLDTGFVDNATPESVAGVILHEILHNKGFGHMSGVEYAYSVNNQARLCSREISGVGTTDAPHGPHRAALVGDAEMQAIGGDGGLVFDRYCPAGHALYGATLFTSSSGVGVGLTVTLHGLSLTCRPLAGGPGVSTQRAGAGGTAVNQLCDLDEVVVGVRGRADTDVNRLALLCERLADVQARRATPVRALPSTGGQVNLVLTNDIERRCPAGMAVRAIVGRADAVLDQIRLVCEDVALPATAAAHDLAAIGGAGVGTSPRTSREHCTDRGVMTGLYGRLGAAVDRLGGLCLGTARVGGVLGARASAVEHITPAEGRGGQGTSTSFELQCPAGQGLVGVTAGTDPATGAISFVRGSCAPVSGWDSPAGLVALQFTATQGIDNGNGVARSCPRGEFVTGLQLRSVDVTATSTRSVDTIVPLCRRIG